MTNTNGTVGMAVDRRSVTKIVKDLKAAGTDTLDVEVKEAVQKMPASIVESLSAFANASGGTVILGLSEKDGFVPAPGFKARSIADALATISSGKLTPPIRPEIEIVEYAGAQLVVARVAELFPRDKPCYVTERGVYQGSFIRVADGDRKLSAYEIDRLLEDRVQPSFDIEPVGQASVEDLDVPLMQAVLARQRMLHPRIFAALTDEEALLSIRAIARDADGALRPTLAGLLALGTYPQRYFPRLTVAFTAYSGDGAQIAGEKYLDAQTMAGPIPALVEDTVNAVRRNMRAGGVLDQETMLRHEKGDYPLAAVREAVANALMHRDYSQLSRGTAVQVNLYSDRLEVTNPGGLYGTVTLGDLGKPGYSSARNQFLASLLESVPYQGGFVVENRGTGYRLIQEELARAGMPQPEPKDSISMFSLAMRRGAAQLAAPHGFAGGDALVAFLSERGSASTSELVDATGLARSTVSYRLKKLERAGMVERIGEPRSPKQRYKLKTRA